jgi:hypothetical protein
MLKINKINFLSNSHLSKGNWGEISRILKDNFNNNRSNIFCHEWLDYDIKKRLIFEKWIGFLHNPITYPSDYPMKYFDKTLPISKLIKDDYFIEKLQSCMGILVFTNQIKQFMSNSLNFNKIYFIHHPILNYNYNWKTDTYLLHVGQQLRKYHSFLEINTNKKKIILKPQDCPEDMSEMKFYSKKQARELDYLEKDKYLKIMCNSIVFLDLYDVAACNTINECISLNVPIVIKKLPGSLEYLGENYPLYFDTLDEAESKIKDANLIIASHLYLKNMDKKKLSISHFLREFNFFINNL